MIKKIKFIFLPMALIFIGITYTGALFSDSVLVSNNNFSTGTWDTEPDVVINELMWMGSVGHPSDEWIELKNISDHPIDLSGWQLTRKSSGSEVLMLTIESGSITANGYFLISNYAKSSTSSALNVDPNLVDTDVSLANSDLQIKLYKGDWHNSSNLIDMADDGFGSPLAGLNSTQKQSMSRNSSPGDGTLIGNWHTDIVSNSLLYWDIIGNNYGTPGGPNV